MKSKNIFSTVDKAQTEKLISRRIALLTIGQFGLFSLLGARLAYLQLFKHDEYSSLSDENRTTHRLIAPPRGNIIDLSGKILSKNSNPFITGICISRIIKSGSKSVSVLQS